MLYFSVGSSSYSFYFLQTSFLWSVEEHGSCALSPTLSVTNHISVVMLTRSSVSAMSSHSGWPDPEDTVSNSFYLVVLFLFHHFFFFFVVLVFELRALCLNILSHSANPFCFIFETRVSFLCLGWPGLQSYLWFPHSWDERYEPPRPASYWLRWCLMNLCLGCPWTVIFLICDSQVARIIQVSHHVQLDSLIVSE
jgi:hypothetical protein